ncbi:MAG: hypothetical protein HAW58_03285, partial [Candidatus Thioglobus sp.]|nr:hypothetical protein [Candidatus Thioglobus sp.]
MNFQTRLAAKILSLGGVISLPTDTVQGLSCLPNANFGLNKILQLKRRQTAKGLILLAPDKRFFIDFVEDKNLLNKPDLMYGGGVLLDGISGKGDTYSSAA